MERETAELEVTMPDGTTAKVVAKEHDRWIVEKEDGTRTSILPPGFSTERASEAPPRELGS